VVRLYGIMQSIVSVLKHVHVLSTQCLVSSLLSSCEMQDLEVSHTFVDELPGDADTSNKRRQVIVQFFKLDDPSFRTAFCFSSHVVVWRRWRGFMAHAQWCAP